MIIDAHDDLAAEVVGTGRLAASAPPIQVKVNAAATTAEMYLLGEVGWEITLAGVVAALKEIPAKATLTVRINSGGGSVFEGVAVFNALRRAPQAKTVVIEALAASAASFIAMAGDRIEVPDNSFIMIHRAWAMTVGNRNAMADMADLLDRIDGVLADVYAARSGQTREAVLAAMDAETWFRGADAVAFGLADAVLEAVPAAASMPVARFKNAPPELLAKVPVGNVPTLPPPAATAAIQEPPMPDQVITPAVAPAPAAIVVNPPAAATVAELKSLATRAGLGADWVVEQAEAAVTLDVARDRAIDAVASAASRPVITPVRDEGDTARAALEAAFDWKFTAALPPSGIGAEYRGARWMDIARSCVELAGGKTRGASPMDIARAALNLSGHNIKGMATTSDFPGLLGTNVSKRLLAAYSNAAEARNFLRLAFVRRLPDFKTARTVEIGMAPTLEAVLEGATVKMGTIGEASQTYALATYAKRQVLSYQALINDDLGAFDRLPQAWANAAANLEASTVWGLFNTNGNLADGVAWFHATHANTAAGTMTVASLGAARAAMRRQTDASGQRILMTPNTIIVPPELETDARALLAPQVVPATVATTAVNPWLGAFGEPVVGHYLTDTNDYFICAGAGSGYEPIEVAYLEGQDGPMVESFTSDDILGVTTRCTHNFAAAAVTHRTIYRITA